MLKITIIGKGYYNSIWNSLLNCIAENLKKKNYSIDIIPSIDEIDFSKSQLIFAPFINELFYDSKNNMLSENEFTFFLNKIKNNKIKLASIIHEIESLRNASLNNFYQIGFSSCSLLIHLTDYSLKLNNYFKNSINTVIPHPFYENIPNNLTKEQARIKLSISNDTKLILSFGNIRNKNEANFLIRTMENLNKVDRFELITTRFHFSKNPIIYKLKKFFFSKKKYLHLNDKLIDEDVIQLYFNAADILILPRINEENQNSGVIFLATYFKKIIVGPNTGNIGYMLNNLKLPTFDKSNDKSIVNALLKGYKLSRSQNITDENYANLSISNNKEKIANEYCLHFVKILNQT